MKKVFLTIIVTFLMISNLVGVDFSNRDMIIRMNGHDHYVHDFISDTLARAYLAQKASISDTLRILLEEKGVSNPTISVPNEITKITFMQHTTSGKGKFTVRIDSWDVDFPLGACDIDVDFDLLLTGITEIVSDSLSYNLKIGNFTIDVENFEVDSEPKKWYQFWNYFTCPYVGAFVQIFGGFAFMNPLTGLIEDTEIELIVLDKLPGDVNDPDLVQEAIESFPLDFSFSYEGTDSNLVICFNFMQGTEANPTAFTGIQPDPVTHDSYDHIGFGCQFDNFMYAYQNSSWADPTIDNPIECTNTLLSLMSNTSAQSIRLEVPWLKIQGNIPVNRVNCGLDPDFLDSPAGQDTIIAFMSRSTWQDFDSVLTLIIDNQIEPVLQVGHGHTAHAPRVGSNLYMAPNNVPGQDGDKYYVDENTYLYYLKLFAHATVRKYQNQIAFWNIENEINVTKFNRHFYGWRKGDLWDDESQGGFQKKVWNILVNAVHTEDPSGKIVVNFHMLNLVKGLERFGPDCDIIGVNLYPNMEFAAPVLGFAPGELVWATRRALKGLGMDTKEVWITETNYPALHADDPPADISLKDDLAYYSYDRQADYIQSAVETSLQYGAKGFFWFSFWLYEVKSDGYTEYGGLIPKNTLTLKQAPATRFSSTTLEKHPGKCAVQLTNKSIQTGENIEGKISLATEKDSLQSGEIVYALRDRNHTSRTDQRELQGLVHNKWNTNIEFKLVEPFYIAENINEYSRVAYFESTENITISKNISGVTIEFHGPWYYDEETQTQPDCYHPVTTDQHTVFLNQNPNFYSNQPIYRLKASHIGQVTENDIYVFDHWVSPSASVAVFNAQGATTTTNRITPVVFKQDNATVTAHYVSANAEGKEVHITEPVYFPEGSIYLIENGNFYIGIETDDQIIAGTENNKIIFKPSVETQERGWWLG